MKYLYPKLPAVRNFAFFRIGGNGLANCLFVYAKAIVHAHQHGYRLISPAWLNFSIGTYLRSQPDKRHYNNLFIRKNEIGGFKKLWILLFYNRINFKELRGNMNYQLIIDEGITDFFTPILPYNSLVKKYLMDHINPSLLNIINNFDFSNTVALHVRLGDFSLERRTPMDWYVKEIKKINNNQRILLFSDGADEELRDLMMFPNVQRVYFGGALQDIIAISKCSYLIGSDSSFSAWGAYLGQVPCSFYRLEFGCVLMDKSKQCIEQEVYNK